MKQIWPLSGYTIPKMESSVSGAMLTLRFGLSQGCITSLFPLLAEACGPRYESKRIGEQKKGNPVFSDISCRFHENLNPAG